MAEQAPVWFITAASSGFGHNIALEALSRGHKVIATARDTSKLSKLADAGADILALDVTWPLPEIQKVAKQANELYGQINYLVNAAGYILVGAVEETSPEQDAQIFHTNVLALLNTTKAFLPSIRASPSPKVIANFGSLGSWRGGAGYALYAGTKWACSGISESLRAELAPLGVAVTVIEPGYFRTGFLNSTAQVQGEKVMSEYEATAVGETRKLLGQVGGNQPGDVVKGAKVVVDVLTRTGVAEGREIPVRVPLGKDAFAVIKGKCEETVGLLKEWEGILDTTEHE